MLRRRLRGASLVGLLVGLALALFVSAGAAMMAATQLAEHRRLLQQAQAEQDLRRSADLVLRELRRAGHWRQAQDGVWSPSQAGAAHPLPELDLASGEVSLHYHRNPGQQGPYGFKLQDGVLKIRMAGAGWQELTDGQALHLTAFDVQDASGTSIALPCAGPCEDAACAAALRLRHLRVTLGGYAAHEPSVPRMAAFEVRVRNDRLVEASGPTAGEGCR